MAKSPKRIVLKFGSGVLTTPGGNALDKKQFGRIASEIAQVIEAGHQCLIVSSAAVAAGLSAFGLKNRPEDLASRQACAAVGQSKLMRMYESAFARHKLNVAQLLLTHGDIDSRLRSTNARNTLQHLLSAGNIVPVINENDSVAVEELKFGDNDRLSAEVAMLAQASLLIILTSVDGLLDGQGNVVPVVHDPDAVNGLVKNEKGRLSVGGMATKLDAVRLAVNAGIPTTIASGRRPGQIAAILAGKSAGTRFPARNL
jgi:glutamate 5-kinase